MDSTIDFGEGKITMFIQYQIQIYDKNNP